MPFGNLCPGPIGMPLAQTNRIASTGIVTPRHAHPAHPSSRMRGHIELPGPSLGAGTALGLGIGNAQLLHQGHRQAHRQTISPFGRLQARPVGLALEALRAQRKLLGTSGM